MNRRFLTAAVLIAATVTSCKESLQESPNPVEESTPLSLSITIDDLSSKTAYEPDGGGLKCSWNAGDSVSVLALKNGKLVNVYQFVTATGGKTASFEGHYSGEGVDSFICVYPPLKGSKSIGFKSRRLPGASEPSFRISVGDDCLTFAGGGSAKLSQAADADASHIAYIDLMTGVADPAQPASGVNMTKHIDVWKVLASIPALTANEKIRSMTLTLSGGSPFSFGTATLPLSSSALWSSSSSTSSWTITFGPYQMGNFSGLLTDAHTLTTYIPVFPLASASALQGDVARTLTVSVRTDKGIYEVVKNIPARTGSGEYAYALTGGRLDTINAALEKISDVGVPTGTCEPDLGWVFFDEGPYTLDTTLDDINPGTYTLKLVTDMSLIGNSPNVIFTCQTTIGSDGKLHVDLGNLDPGFYQVRLGSSYSFIIGVRPDAVYSPIDAKPDFDQFWAETFAELDAIPYETELTPVAEYTNSTRACYEVRYKSFGGAISGGVISIPVAAGKYPVKLKFMGYGNTQTYFSPNSNPGYIEFEVSIRSQGLFKSGSKWDCQGLESKETYYYRGAYCDVKRAIDYVMSLDKTDPDRVVAWGSSQGGALATIAAALDSRIKATSPTAPFLSDFPDYYKIATFPMNNDIFPAADAAGIPRSQVLDMLTYFDVKNFAPRITCPVLMVIGLQDVTCPPHTNLAIYNNLSSTDKQYLILPKNIHNEWSNPLTSQRVNAFLAQYLK